MKKIVAMVAAAATALALGLGAASAAGLTTPVYFQNDSGPASVVNVYVDGQKTFDNVFSSDVSTFPISLTPGEHQVVITPNYAQPGQADILAETITVPASGSFTLTLSDTVNNSNDLSGYSLNLDNSAPDSE